MSHAVEHIDQRKKVKKPKVENAAPVAAQQN